MRYTTANTLFGVFWAMNWYMESPVGRRIPPGESAGAHFKVYAVVKASSFRRLG